MADTWGILSFACTLLMQMAQTPPVDLVVFSDYV